MSLCVASRGNFSRGLFVSVVVISVCVFASVDVVFGWRCLDFVSPSTRALSAAVGRRWRLEH